MKFPIFHKNYNYEMATSLVAELIAPYTLEKFVIYKGYVLVEQSGHIKIYRKQL